MKFSINLENWLPKSVTSLRSYSKKDFSADIVAGITVGLVALPLAMAFGISSGVTPQAGIYTAVIAGFLISALGGSRTQIGGPTGAFVVVIAAIIAKHGLSGLLMVTIMAGMILLFLGLTGLGSAIKFIPRPVVIGFTNGIALLIASTQIKDFLGLTGQSEVPSEFIERMEWLGTNMASINLPALLLGIASLLVIIFFGKISKKLPGTIVALILATIVTALFDLPVATIGTAFGGIPTGLPQIQMPEFIADLIIPLFPAALTVALLAAIESLLSAVVADSMSGDRHNSNVELVAQGVANVVVPFFGGLPVTGAIARTATNIRSGAKSPVAGMVHALTLLCILVFAAPLARFIPLTTLAAVLFIVAYNMGEWHEILHIIRLEAKDIVVWMITFLLTVVADLTVAVEVGLALAALLYIYQVTKTTRVAMITPDLVEKSRQHNLQNYTIPPYISLVHVQGPLLFGTAEKLTDILHDINNLNRIVILRLRHTTALDATGLHAIERLHSQVKATGRTFMICGARQQPKRLLYTSTLPRVIGARNILPNIEIALKRAEKLQQSSFNGLETETAKKLSTMRI